MFSRYLAVAVATLVLLAGAGNARAQSSLQVPLQFDFLNPGARSLALGGAFAGLADDATSAFTNPAGLTLLIRPEVSAEGRFRRIVTPFLERGRLSGTLTNRGDDIVAGAAYGESTINTSSPSFFSFVYPKGRWAVAGYRHELVKLRDRFVSRGVFQDVPIGGAILPQRELPLEARRDVDIVNYGFSAGYRVNDQVSVGGGLSVYQLNLDSTFRRFGTVGDIYGEPSFSNELFRITQVGEDVGLAFSGGVQMTVHSKVRVGAVYRGGPSFDVQIEETVSNFRREGTMRIPGAFSAGVAVRPQDNLALALDYTYVRYEALEEDYITMQTGTRPERFTINNGSEVHGGIEYVFTMVRAAPAVRFGVWLDPDHSVRYESTAANDAFDIRYAATLPGGDDLVHYTTGLGLSFSPQFEFNIGGDFTSKRKTVASSVIFRF